MENQNLAEIQDLLAGMPEPETLVVYLVALVAVPIIVGLLVRAARLFR